MVLLLICVWDHSGLRLNTAYCASILRLFIGDVEVFLAFSTGLGSLYYCDRLKAG